MRSSFPLTILQFRDWESFAPGTTKSLLWVWFLLLLQGVSGDAVECVQELDPHPRDPLEPRLGPASEWDRKRAAPRRCASLVRAESHRGLHPVTAV